MNCLHSETHTRMTENGKYTVCRACGATVSVKTSPYFKKLAKKTKQKRNRYRAVAWIEAIDRRKS